MKFRATRTGRVLHSASAFCGYLKQTTRFVIVPAEDLEPLPRHADKYLLDDRIVSLCACVNDYWRDELRKLKR
jgi:hypothetical protein